MCVDEKKKKKEKKSQMETLYLYHLIVFLWRWLFETEMLEYALMNWLALVNFICDAGSCFYDMKSSRTRLTLAIKSL